MQFEISHGDQVRAAKEVEQFKSLQASILIRLDSEITGLMAKSAGAYNLAFNRVKEDVKNTEAGIRFLLDEMNEKMLVASGAYDAEDADAKGLLEKMAVNANHRSTPTSIFGK